MTEKEWDEKEKELFGEIAIINKLEQELKRKANIIAQNDLMDRCRKVCNLLQEIGLQEESHEYRNKAANAHTTYLYSPQYEQALEMTLIEGLEKFVPEGKITGGQPIQGGVYRKPPLTEEDRSNKEKELRNEIKIANNVERELKKTTNPIAQKNLVERYKKVCKLLEELGRRNEVLEYQRKAETAHMIYVSSAEYKEAQRMASV